MNIKKENKVIYDMLCDAKKDIIKTDGEVEINKWIATTALSIAILILMALVNSAL